MSADADLDDVVLDCRAANAITAHLEHALTAEVARRRANGRRSIAWGVVGLLVGVLLVIATQDASLRARVSAWTTLISGALSLTRGIVLVCTRSALSPLS